MTGAKLTSPLREAWALIARLAAYAALMGLAFEVVVLLASSGAGAEIVAEQGPLENVQLGLSLAAGIMLLVAASRSASSSGAFAFAGLVCLFLSVRELDRLFDVALWHGAWKWVATPIVAAALYVLWRLRSRLGEELAGFVRTPTFHLLFFGFAVLLVYAQIVGQKELWQAVMGAHYLRDVKDAVEETTELLGYLVIAFAGLEAVLHARGETRGG